MKSPSDLGAGQKGLKKRQTKGLKKNRTTTFKLKMAVSPGQVVLHVAAYST